MISRIDPPQSILSQDPAIDFALKDYFRKLSDQLLVINRAIENNATYTDMQTEVVANNSGGY